MKKLHYSWVVCAGGMLLMFATTGLTITAFSVYQPYIISVNGFSNTQASMLFTLRSLFSLIALFFIDRYYRALNLRAGITLMAALAGVSFCLFASAHSYFMYCVSAALGGVAYGMGGMVPVSLLIGRWFRDRTALALSICSAGTGLAAVIVPPLVTKAVERWSLSTAFASEGVLIFFVAAVIFLIVRNSPGEMKRTPYRSGKAVRTREPAAAARKTVTIDRTGFALMAAAMVLLSATGSTAYSHLAVLFSVAGFGSDTVAYMISLAGASLIVGKCCYGVITDRVGAYRSNFFFYGLSTLGCVLCCLADTRLTAVFAGAMFCLGFGLPISSVGVSVWSRDLSDPQHLAGNLKWLQMAYVVGALATGVVPGILADATGSYVPSFVLFTACTFLSFVLVQLSYRRYRRLERAAASAGQTAAN